MARDHEASPRPNSSDLLVGDPERIGCLLSAASRTDNVHARAVFIAEARVLFSQGEERLGRLRLALDEAEAELARQHRGQGALPGVE